MKQKVIFTTILLFAFYFIASTVFKNTTIPMDTQFYWDADNSCTPDSVLSREFTKTGREFTCKTSKGSIWILITLEEDPTDKEYSYTLDFGQDSLSLIELYIKKEGSWTFYGKTGKGQNRKEIQTSFMRDALVINGKHLKQTNLTNCC